MPGVADLSATGQVVGLGPPRVLRARFEGADLVRESRRSKAIPCAAQRVAEWFRRVGFGVGEGEVEAAAAGGSRCRFR